MSTLLSDTHISYGSLPNVGQGAQGLPASLIVPCQVLHWLIPHMEAEVSMGPSARWHGGAQELGNSWQTVPPVATCAGPHFCMKRESVQILVQSGGYRRVTPRALCHHSRIQADQWMLQVEAWGAMDYLALHFLILGPGYPCLMWRHGSVRDQHRSSIEGWGHAGPSVELGDLGIP